MSQMIDTGRIRPLTSQSMEGVHLNQEILERVTGMIRLGIGVLNSLIGLRYALKLMGANPANAFAELVYATTRPFLSMFQGLFHTLTYEGMVFEFHDLIAIAVYGLLGWIAIQLLQVMFGRVK